MNQKEFVSTRPEDLPLFSILIIKIKYMNIYEERQEKNKKISESKLTP